MTLVVKLVTQLTNRGLNAKRVEQWDRYLVPQNVFLVDTSFQKNVKSHVFLKSEKKHKIRILEHWARCVTFAVARIRVGNRRNFAYFPSGTESMGNRGSKKAYTGPRTGIYMPAKFGCDRSIVVGCTCKSRNDRQTSRQTNRME